jgi:phosphate transport system substrate-binding protein
MANLKLMNNEMAVSPIVATLVLIVVAVIGAVAVGTIMGTFSTDVSKTTNANQAAGASATEIIVAGSTTIDPVTQAMAKIYSVENPGIHVSSQATGSGAGFQAMTLGVADIGAMSEFPDTAKLTQNPNTVQYRIGSGAVAVITNHASPAATTAVAPADLYLVYNGIPAAPFDAATIGVTRSDSSGTADTFFKFIAGKTQSGMSFVNAANPVVSKAGNAGVVQYVGSTAKTVGYGDFGYVSGRTDVDMLAINDGIYTYPGVLGGSSSTIWAAQYANLTTAAQAEYRNNVEKTKTGGQADAKGTYNITMIHPLVYLTNGAPSSSIVKNYIQFAQSGAATQAFKDTNTFALSQVF